MPSTLTRTVLRHPLRTLSRSLWLLGVMAWYVVDYQIRVAWRSRGDRWRLQGEWLQRGCRRVLQVLHVEMEVKAGTVPKRGLLVSNHLGYLDVFVLSTLTPAAFIAKDEIESWPVLGWYARMAGTVFVRREKRSEVVETTEMIRKRLASDRLVVLFAEGTSTGGDRVLPFKSSLIAPALREKHPITAGCIGYELVASDGDVSEEVCFWTDAAFLPHLLNLLSKKAITARVSFEAGETMDLDRKELAKQLREQVLKLREEQSE